MLAKTLDEGKIYSFEFNHVSILISNDEDLPIVIIIILLLHSLYFLFSLQYVKDMQLFSYFSTQFITYG